MVLDLAKRTLLSAKTVAQLVLLSPLIVPLVVLPALAPKMPSTFFGAIRHAFASEIRQPEHPPGSQSVFDEVRTSDETNDNRDFHDAPSTPLVHALAPRGKRSPKDSEDDLDESRHLSTDPNTSNADDSLLSADLYLGPQMTPYVHRRDRTHSIHATTATNENSPARQRIPTAPAHLSSHSVEQILKVPEPQPITISAPPPMMSFSTDVVPLFTPRLTTSMTRLSTWRQEQLKNMKQGRVTSTHLRKIPTLHGTLSLPYARNPSGVDSAVHDEDALLQLVQESDHRRPQSSEMTREPASSRPRGSDSDQTRPPPFDRTHQAMGFTLKNFTTQQPDVALARGRDDKENRPVGQDVHPVQRTHRIALRTIDAPQSGLSSVNPAHSTPTAVKATGIGLGAPALPTIPGSPSVETAPEQHLFSDDYLSSATNDFSNLHYSSDERKSSWGTGSGSLSMTGGSRIPSDGSTQSSIVGLAGQYSKGSTLAEPSPGGSKADSSINWRFRGMDLANNKVIFSTPPKPSRRSYETTSPATLPPDVLTIDALFQRFNGKDDRFNVPFKTPGSDPAIKQVSDKPFAPTETP